jgi:D-alanyl-D-alanine carboxypeptidase/D-alanyl-D-alanine-endopeptidase (penicillin-binding protein 4)
MRTIVLLLAAAASYAADLAHAVDTLVDSSVVGARANIGISVVDLRTGKPVYARNENHLFLPASNMKLFTTALALRRLGPDFRFETRLIAEAGGDVVLVGSGDPSMSGRVYPYDPGAAALGPLHAIEELADQAVVNGLMRVEGDVVGDDRLYPWVPYPPNWSQDDAVHESGAPVSALSVTDNFITITIAPGSVGEPATVSLSPALEYLAIDNRVLTTAGKGAAQVRVTRVPGGRQILLAGSIPVTSTGVRETVALDDPALYAAGALYEALTRRGVFIAGHPTVRHRDAADRYQAPEGMVLATRTSPPAAQLIQMADKVSENLHAELLLREIGHSAGGSGTREAGVAALGVFLKELGGAAEDSRIDDGSGLSRNEVVTPRLVTRLLAWMYGSSFRDAWIAMLPVGGEDGTLSRRMANSIHAKTGTLNRAIALSGYAESKSRGWLAFSILVNDFAAPAAEVQAWIDKIAMTLLE